MRSRVADPWVPAERFNGARTSLLMDLIAPSRRSSAGVRPGSRVPAKAHMPGRVGFERFAHQELRTGSGRCWHRAYRGGERQRRGGSRKDCHRRPACVRYERVCRRPAGSRYRTAESSCVAGAPPSSWPTASREHRWSTSLHCASRILAARRPVFIQGRWRDSPERLQFQLPDPQAAVSLCRGLADPQSRLSTPCRLCGSIAAMQRAPEAQRRKNRLRRLLPRFGDAGRKPDSGLCLRPIPREQRPLWAPRWGVWTSPANFRSLLVAHLRPCA